MGTVSATYFAWRQLVFLSLFTLISDLVLATGLRKLASVRSLQSQTGPEPNYSKPIFDAIRVQSLNWLRLQVDRIVIVIFSSPTVAGLYFLSSSLAKVVSETLNSGGNAYLVAESSKTQDTSYIREQISRSVLVTQVLNFILFFVATYFAEVFSTQSSSWLDLMPTVPLMALSIFPIALFQPIWASTFVKLGTTGKERIQIVGAILTCIGAFLVSVNLIFGAFALLLKDLFLAVWVCNRWRDYLTYRSAIYTALPMFICSLFVLVEIF
jgi:hypothetical protein